MSEDTADLPPAKRTKVEVDYDSTQPNYGVHVTAEEVDKLRQFQVLDEVKSDDEDSNDEGSDKSSSDELPEEEIERMLEEDLPDEFKGAPKPMEKKYIKRQKIVLEEKGINYFEVLPLDWLMVRHASGMPVYMHRGTRVCTLSKPYFLGKENTRRHDIPISAIPCLAYRIALKEEQKQMEIDRQIADQIKNGTWVQKETPENQNQAQNNTPNEKNNVENKKNDVENKNNDVENKKNDVENKKNNVENKKEVKNVKAEVTQNSNKSEETSQKCEESCPYPKSSKHKDLPHIPSNHPDISTELPQNSSVLPQNSSVLPQNSSVVPQNSSVLPQNSPNLPQNPLETYVGIYENQDSQDSLPEKTGCPYQKRLNHLKDEINDSNESESSKPDAKSIEENGIELLEDSQSSVPLSQSSEPSPPASARPVVLPGGLVMPPPRVETVNTSWKSQQLSPSQLNEYCKKLFKFKEVYIMHFKRWADRRKYTKARKTMQYPTLPEGTKLITIPAQENARENGGKSAKRDWVMNMNGGSYLSVFHEYVRRALHKQPVYHFKQLENATAPYQATVYIGGMQYGVGQGSSKRQAKSQAARASIHILIPEMRDELPTSPGDLDRCKDEPDFSFFDYVTIEDPRIQEFCGAAAEPSPHAILRTCLLRNFGAQDRHINTEMNKLEYQKIELTMKVGKHSATVVCKNKKLAKQRASQAILQQLHPHITSWGSLLRLYGSRSMKSCKEKKLEEQQITLLQDKARHNEPNHAVLEKLRTEMDKLKERDHAVVPIGTLMLTADLPQHSGSNLNNVDL